MGQALQLPRVLPPGALRKLPWGQGVHLEDPGWSAKKPGLHSVHSMLPVLGVKVPMGHCWQASTTLTPPCLMPKVPLGQ